jgi:hypothetical protein
METTIQPTEARTLTALEVSTSIIAPIGRIIDAHLPTDMDIVRLNERSSTTYNLELKDLDTGIVTPINGHYTVGFESSTIKPTLGFNLNAMVHAIDMQNSPVLNKFFNTFVDAMKMAQAGASDEDIDAHYAVNGIKNPTGKVTGKRMDQLKGNAVRTYSAIVKVHPSA